MTAERFGIAWLTSLQQEIPPERLARVSSYDAVGSWAAMPFAQVGAGSAVQAVGVRRPCPAPRG